MVVVSRRRFLAASAAAGLGLAVGDRVAAGAGGDSGSQQLAVALERVAGGFTSPLGFEAPAGTDRQYVVDQTGTVDVIVDGTVEDRPFLDVTDRMVTVEGYTETGLLGLAFHPDFPDDDRCFVRYSAPPRDGTPDGFSHTFVLAEFRATPDRADPGSERTLLAIPQPQSNHNSGAVAFGPDGYCYVGTGDGGASGDQGRGHVADWYDGVAGGNGQDVTENLLGSILRIDVDASDGDRPYGIPGDNPLVGRSGLDEQYAWGFRNPWRVSFDGENLLVADVGQNAYEEVDLVTAGGNYGWNVREGTHCFQADDCPGETPDGRPLRAPVIEYGHDRGIAVIGGHVYRGSAVPELSGRYVFGDWQGDGGPTLFAATPVEEGLWPVESVELVGDADPGQYLLAFGEDPDGELYLCTNRRPTVGGSTGELYRIAAPDDGTATGTDRSTGATGGTAAGGTTDSDGTADGGRELPGLTALAGGIGLAGAGIYRYLRSRGN